MSRCGFRHFFWTRGEPWNSVRTYLAPRVLRTLHAALMCSVRVSVSGENCGQAFRRSRENAEGALLVSWHDQTMVPLHLLCGRGLSVIASRSRSGRINALFLRLLGVKIVWGSTGKREGIRALREVIPRLRQGEMVMVAPDGPKGPRHVAQPGIVYLATRAPATIYPWGVAASAAWRLPTWDGHLIPKPFSRVHLHLGEPLSPPIAASRDEIARFQEIIGQALDNAEATAEERLRAG